MAVPDVKGLGAKTGGNLDS